MKVKPRLYPCPFDRALGYAPHMRDLGDREAAKELEIDELREIRIDGRELVQRLADLRELVRAGGGVGDIGVERRELEAAATFLRLATPNVVDDQSAHRARSVCHEMRLIGERDLDAPRHVQERFMKQRRGAQRLAAAVTRKLAPRHAMQLVVQHLEKLLR